MSMSYRVVRLAPSSRASDSIVIAWAGQMASQSLQAVTMNSWSGLSIPVMLRKAGGGVTDRCSAPRPRRSDGERARHGTGTKPVPFLLTRQGGLAVVRAIV